MKKLVAILVFICAVFYSYAQDLEQSNNRSVWTTYKSICIGDSSYVSLLEDFDQIIYCVYSHNGIYDTSYTTGIILWPDTNPNNTVLYTLESVNGEIPVDTYQWIVSSKLSPIIAIPVDSINHVTCPNGDFNPYGDGSFHVELLDPIQNYTWVKVTSDSSFFFEHTYYDDFTVSGLRGGTYQVEALGTNGCVYRDSVVIEQPAAWVENMDYLEIDTVCFGQTGCVYIPISGGTPPYDITWFYLEDSPTGIDTVFMEDSTLSVCGLYSGRVYYIYMYDSRGCKAFGEEIEFMITYLFEYVEDTTHIITIDPVACYGHEFIVQAQSIGVGTYIWTVGNVDDTTNYGTDIYGDSMLVASYMTPPLFQPTYVVATFSDQHGCVTHDSIWVDVYNPGLSLSIETEDIITDSACIIHVSPLGGSLYLDGMLIVENVPDPYTLSTSGISVGEHTLKYAGVFGMEQGLYCEEEVEVSFNVQSHPFVTDWDQEISIYPNPATTMLNLSSTEMMDFTICITDITGRVVLREKVLDSFYPVDVSSLTSGIYLLRLETPEGANKMVKFVKR